MVELSNVSDAALRDAVGNAVSVNLTNAARVKAVERVTAALAYRDGVSADALSDRLGIPRSTIYYWPERLEEASIEAAVEDDGRPGRPRSLGRNERVQLRSDPARSPRAFGFETESWSTGTVRDRGAEKYGVEYSEDHIRRSLRSLRDDSPVDHRTRDDC